MQSTPTLAEYVEGVREFQNISREWHSLEDHNFYTVNNDGYYESSDNARGGLSCRWAFHREFTESEISLEYQRLLSEYNALIAESEE